MVKITEVKIFRKENRDKKLKAFATVTFDDCFVVRDLKVIEGSKGLFVAMPSRRVKEPCPNCGHRNVVRSKFCNNCGKPLQDNLNISREDEHRDIAHPINLECREMVQKAVLGAYNAEVNIGSSGEGAQPAPAAEAEAEPRQQESSTAEETPAGE